MKKILTTFALLCLYIYFVQAQVKVHPNGTVHLGNTSICIYNLAGKQL